MRKLGFTLIELLAVIVILGVIMMIAIPSVTNYITGARADSYISTVQELIQGVRNYAITEDLLPTYPGQGIVFDLHSQQLEKGGTKSPFGKDWDEKYWYVIIVAGDASDDGSPNYYYFYQGNDTAGNYVPLTEESKLTKKSVSNAGSNAAARTKMNNMVQGYSIVESQANNPGSILRTFNFRNGDNGNIGPGTSVTDLASYEIMDKYLSKNDTEYNSLRLICMSFRDLEDENKPLIGDIGAYKGPTDCNGVTDGPYIKVYYAA